MEKLTIIDGNSLLFRAYYATSYPGASIMSTKDGVPTNAIFAFSNMLNKILSTIKKNDGLFVAFDTDKQTFRKDLLESYKANRKPAPKELIPQFALSRQLLTHLGIKQYEVHGYEADDIASTIAKIAEKNNVKVEIYTSDKDYLQLVSENITVFLIKKGLSDVVKMTPLMVKETFGFEPIKIIDYKGLRGDPSDNLPGIPGIGDKTAVKLIQDYGSFDNIILNKDNIKGKLGENIRTYAEQGILSRDMAIMKSDMDLPFCLADTVYLGYDFKDINAFAQRYELKQFITRLPTSWKKKDINDIKLNIQDIKTIDGINLNSTIGLNLVYEGNYHDPDIKYLLISSGECVYKIAKSDLIQDKLLKNILADKEFKKCGYDLKSIIVALSTIGIELNNVTFDVLIASYLLDSSLKSSEESVFALFGICLTKEEESLSLLLETNPYFEAKVAYYSHFLENKIRDQLKNIKALSLFDDLEMPLLKVLAKMEIEGFPISEDVLDSFKVEYSKNIEELQKQIYQLASTDSFNINSFKQLGAVLVDKLHIPLPKSMSTSFEVLTPLRNSYPIISKILEYRKYTKLVSTYIDGFKPFILKDNKVHTIFNQAMTTTGRLSSSSPNMQNISVRDEESKKIRKAFFYDDDDYELLSLDYSQIELRLLADLSKCQKLIDVFNNDEDIHASTAKSLFSLTREPSESERRKAKAVNFGIVYGISDYGLSEQLSITVKEAHDIIERFYQTYPEIKTFLASIVDKALEDGYVETLSGRRRYLRELHDNNYQKREFAKRAAMNAPIQGSAADLIKIAMIRVDKMLLEGNFKTKMVLQIHDELIFKVAKNEKEIVYPLIKQIMEEAIKISVKLKVDGGFAKSWYDCK